MSLASSSRQEAPRVRKDGSADGRAPAPASSTATPTLDLTAGSVLALQRTAGNQAVQRVLARQPAAPPGSIQRTPDLETWQTFKGKGKKTFGKRPSKYGPVKIQFEDVPHVKYTKIVRPIRVSGLVYPSATGERPGAPEPVSNVRVSEAKRGMPKVGEHGEEARNQGITDAQKGHIMALELGGPDIPQNIVPQWAQWQSNGEWRQMEREVLALAQAVEEKGNFLHYAADLHYKPYGDQWIRYAPKKSVGMPSAFTVTITEIDGKTQKPIGSKNTRVAFAEEQRQNRTDDMMFMRTLQEMAGKAGESFEYPDWNPQAKKEKKKKGKEASWKGAWRDDTSLNPFAEREAQVRKQQATENVAWADYQEGFRDGYDYVEEDYNSEAYLFGYDAGREAYVEDYGAGFVDGFKNAMKQNGQGAGYYGGYSDGVEHRQKGGKTAGGWEESGTDADYEMVDENDDDDL